MRIIKDPFTGKLLISLDAFEMKNVKEKSVFEITYSNLKIFFDDIYSLINVEVDKIIKELKENKMVGVANGRAEFGPRALGNRSLLADPRGKEIKDLVNAIKKRQKFRPFAPAILEEDVNEYFDLPTGVKNTPYMQYTAACTHGKDFPAIIHYDNTSRVQTVRKTDNPGFHALLTEWKKQTGCPILLNTSLNIKGQPIVNDREDAEAFSKKYGVKVC